MKRVLSAILVVVLLVACLPVTGVFAKEVTPAKVEKLQVSEQLIAMVKKEEGFSKTAYWDYSQYSIGYGCAVKNKNNQVVRTKAEVDEIYPNGITEAEADKLLRQRIAEDYAAPVNNFAVSRGFVFNQYQFDALVSFTYNVGSAWMQKQYRVVQWIEKNLSKKKLTAAEELDFVDSMGAWCRAGDEILPALCRRRINEAKIFLFGEYSGGSTPRDFSYAIFHAGEGTMPNKYEDMVAYYIRGAKLEQLPTPNALAGHTFTGWAFSDGSPVTTATKAQKQGMLIYAQWKTESGETVPTETKPEPTGTEATEPKPTESEPDKTEPTEPEPTETEPTDPEETELPYTDVPEGSWYETAVKYVYGEKLFFGTTDTTFGPSENMTRAMLVTVLWRHAGRPNAGEEAGFVDVPKTNDESCYYAIPVAWAKEYGIVAGVSDTEFGPGENITREQLATILYRYCTEYWGIEPENSADLDQFQDADRIHSYAKEAVQWAVGNGIISGMGDGTLVPRGSATRAQVASMLKRMVENILY